MEVQAEVSSTVLGVFTVGAIDVIKIMLGTSVGWQA